jgi:adenylate cyclase
MQPRKSSPTPPSSTKRRPRPAPPLGLDIALHEGEVTYGNVGTEDRLDFTVIGPAVNEASRLAGLCKELGLPLLVSDSFAEASPEVRARPRSVGPPVARGEGGAAGVYGLALQSGGSPTQFGLPPIDSRIPSKQETC